MTAIKYNLCLASIGCTPSIVHYDVEADSRPTVLAKARKAYFGRRGTINYTSLEAQDRGAILYFHPTESTIERYLGG